MTTFDNPVISGWNPDPTVVRVKDDYFLVTSSFEYFPGLPIYHSKDLLNWELIGHGLTRSSQLNLRTSEPGAGIWAATLRFHDGKFYLTTAKWDRYRPQYDERIFPRGFYISTDNIWDDRSWSDPVYFDNPGFDQDLFWDGDGKVYLSTTMRMSTRPKDSKLKGFAIHVSEIDLTTGRTLTAPTVIRESPYGLAEGSHIIKRNQYYYLFTAEGGTESGHQEWCLRSEKGPLGPWQLGPTNPLWYNGTTEEIQNTGHADIFEDSNGHWWSVFLGSRPRLVDGTYHASQLGRETFLVKVDWEDDWPIFNNGKNITIRTEGRSGKQIVQQSLWKLDLSQETLELGWYQKHTPLKQEWSLSERPGYLRLYGGCYNLSSPEAPTLLLRKQTAFNQAFQAELDFQPAMKGYEAGITVWWSMYSYASIGITRTTTEAGLEERVVVLNLPTEEIGVMAKSVQSINSDGPVAFEIRGNDVGYSLGFSSGGIEQYSSPPVPAKFFPRTPPVGGAFTGVFFGLYSQGLSEPCLDPADFKDISIGH